MHWWPGDTTLVGVFLQVGRGFVNHMVLLPKIIYIFIYIYIHINIRFCFPGVWVVALAAPLLPKTNNAATV